MGRLIHQIGVRLFQGLFVVFGVSTLTFVFLVSTPGDPAMKLTLAQYGEDGLTPDRVEMVRREFGLDRGLPVLYTAWLTRTLALDLGRSMVTGDPVLERLGFHLKFSLKLAGAALVFSTALGLGMGIWAGLRPGSVVDILSAAFSSLMVSLPGFILGALLILVFAVKLNLLPAAGFHRPVNLILPALTLGLGLSAVFARVVRTAVMEVKDSFFLTFARVKGLSFPQVALGHGARHTAVPIVTFLALQLAHVLDGVVVIESLFNWPGIGFLLLESIRAGDLTVIQAISLFVGLTYVGANLVADLVCVRLDPRRLVLKGSL